MPKKAEPQIPLSDVVQLLSGRKPAKKRKRVAKRRVAQPAPPAPFTNRPGFQGVSAFSTVPIRMIPSAHQQFIQPPPQVVKPIQEAERAQTININTNYDPDRRRVEVVSDSKSGVLPIEMNPNDISPRIAAHRLIEAQPSAMSQRRIIMPPVQEPFQPQNPAGRLGTDILPIEAIPSAPYDPLRPGGMPYLVDEKYAEEELMPPVDPGNLQSEEQFEEYYAPKPKRLSKLTRFNQATGQFEQYRRGGILKRAEGGVVFDSGEAMLRRNALPLGQDRRWRDTRNINFEELMQRKANGGMISSNRVIVPPGNPRDHFRGRPWEDVFA